MTTMTMMTIKRIETMIPTKAPIVNPQQIQSSFSCPLLKISEPVLKQTSSQVYSQSKSKTQIQFSHYQEYSEFFLNFSRSHSFKLLLWQGASLINFLTTSDYSVSPKDYNCAITTSIPATPNKYLISSYTQYIGIDTVTILPNPKASSYGQVQTGESIVIPSDTKVQYSLITVTNYDFDDDDSSILNSIPEYQHESYLRISVSIFLPSAQENRVIFNPKSSIISFSPLVVCSPTVGAPSVKNNIIFSPSRQGAPNSSLVADLIIFNPFSNAA